MSKMTAGSKDGTKIIFLNIQVFSRYSIRSCINEYRSNIFFHVLRHKFGPG